MLEHVILSRKSKVHQEIESKEITLFYDGILLKDDSIVASLKLQSG